MPKTSSIRSSVLVELRLVTDSWYRGCIASRGKNYATSEFGVFARSVGVKPLKFCSTATRLQRRRRESRLRRSTLLRQKFFSQRVVNVWNKLTASVVEATSVNTFKKRLDEWIDVELIISPVLLIHYCYKLQVTSYPPSFGIRIVVLDIRGCVRNVSQSAIWLYDKTPAWHTQTSTRHLRALSHASPGRYN